MPKRAVGEVQEGWRCECNRHERNACDRGAFVALVGAMGEEDERHQQQPLRIVAEVLIGHVNEPRYQQEESHPSGVRPSAAKENHASNRGDGSPFVGGCGEDRGQR